MSVVIRVVELASMASGSGQVVLVLFGETPQIFNFSAGAVRYRYSDTGTGRYHSKAAVHNKENKREGTEWRGETLKNPKQ